MGIRERKKRAIETRRRLILSAAKDLFVRKGSAGATLDEVAAAIEFSKGTIYNHFGSKEEIFAWILLEQLDILLASLREAIGQGRNAGEKLQNAAKAYLRFYRDNREYFRLLFFFDMFSDHARIPETLLKEIRNRKIACLLELQGVVKDTGLQGRTAGGRTMAQVSLVLWGMINGIIQLAESRQVKEEDLDRLIGVGFEIATLGLGQPAS